jgi:hypothetical protein
MNTPSSISLLRILFVLAAAGLLAGCQHRTPYRASTGDGEPGYTSWQQSDSSVFFVKYVGSPGAKLPEVRDLALLRAAELTRAAGSREFVLLAERSGKRTDWVQHNTAPPQSPLVGTGEPGYRSADQRELETRSRSMITSSPAMRVEMPMVELKVSTRPDAKHRAMDASAPYAVDTLLRDIPGKYGLTLGARS